MKILCRIFRKLKPVRLIRALEEIAQNMSQIADQARAELAVLVAINVNLDAISTALDALVANQLTPEDTETLNRVQAELQATAEKAAAIGIRVTPPATT